MYLGQFVYLLCTFTSFLATALLWKNFQKTGVRLLFWSAFCFLGFTLNNVMLFADVVLLPSTNLAIFRTLPAVIGLGGLLFGFIWETSL